MRHSAYWLRKENGVYETLPWIDLSLRARVRGLTNLSELRHEAKMRPVRVQYRAGLKPGIYADSMVRFLNPEFVPLKVPLAAPDPPPEFVDLAQKLGQWLDQDKKRFRLEIHQTQERLMEIFQESRGVKPVKSRREGEKWWLRELPSNDHCRLFAGGNDPLWTSQPYHYDLSAILGCAHQHKLSVSISPKWGWYYPGKATLIEWTNRQRT